MITRRTIAGAGVALALGASLLTGSTASAVTPAAPVPCASLPTTPTTVTAAMARAAATCTPDVGLAPLTTRQCPKILEFISTDVVNGWDGANTWYLFPGTPDTCGTRSAAQDLISLNCDAFGGYDLARTQWIDSGGVTRLAPAGGVTVACADPDTQYVMSAGFPSYAFYLRIQLQQGQPHEPDCVHDGCDIYLRK